MAFRSRLFLRYEVCTPSLAPQNGGNSRISLSLIAYWTRDDRGPARARNLTAVQWHLEVTRCTWRSSCGDLVEGWGAPATLSGANRGKHLNSGHKKKIGSHFIGILGPNTGLNSFYPSCVVNVIFVSAKFSNRVTFPCHLLANCVGVHREKKNGIPIVWRFC